MSLPQEHGYFYHNVHFTPDDAGVGYVRQPHLMIFHHKCLGGLVAVTVRPPMTDGVWWRENALGLRACRLDDGRLGNAAD